MCTDRVVSCYIHVNIYKGERTYGKEFIIYVELYLHVQKGEKRKERYFYGL